MKILLGCKAWTSGAQHGFRIYATGIRSLVPYLTFPSANGRWPALGDFYKEAAAAHHPQAYSRHVLISDGTRTIAATATLAQHGASVQGYITAATGTWLNDYVVNRLGADLECEYAPQRNQDFILIPKATESVPDRLEAVESAARRKVRTDLRRFGAPPDAAEVGLFFEREELTRLQAEFAKPAWEVRHRYPAIDSSVPLLRQNDISCDIDVISRAGKVSRCVEVKSISGAPGSPFILSRREWKSRLWCRNRNLPYSTVVYYHTHCQIIERRVIPETVNLKFEPFGYICYHPDLSTQ